MFLVGIISWWYSKGWRRHIQSTKSSLGRTIDFFSIEILLKTLFMPYKQISAGSTRGASLGEAMSAFFDKLTSRMIGAMLRIIVLLAGILAISVQVLGSLLMIIFWGIMPVIPIVGLVLMTIGWNPIWL